MTADLGTVDVRTGRPGPSTPVRVTVLVAIALVAVGVRALFLDRESLDYLAFLRPWYDYIDAHDGIFALTDRFADYNYPYLYLLAGLTYLHIPPLVGIKAVSVVFDMVLAVFVYRIVGIRHERFVIRALAFALVLLLPTVVLNSGWWGQADSIYSAFVVGGVYFLMRRRPWWAMSLIGLALSFKLQTVFIAPVVVWLVLRRWVPWRSVLAIPAVVVALDIPAVLVGAPLSTVVSVYADQAGSYKSTTLAAANVYQLLPFGGNLDWLAYSGIGVAGFVVVAFLTWSQIRRPAITPTSIIAVSVASVLVVPYLLPSMHDRYFYPAEVLTVVAAFFLPLVYIAVPVLVQIAGLGVYHQTLDGPLAHRAAEFLGHHRDFRMSGTGARAGWPGRSDHYVSGRGDAQLQIYAWLMTSAILLHLGALVHVLRGRDSTDELQAPNER